MKLEAEVLVWSQGKERLGLPKARRAKEDFLLGLFRESRALPIP